MPTACESRSSRSLGPAALMLAALLAVGPGPVAADDTVASDPVFSALTTDGTTSRGRIRRFTEGGEVVLVATDGAEKTLSLDRIVKLSRENLTAPLSPEPMVVLFPEGDRLHRAAITRASETTIDVQSYSLGSLSVPLEGLLGLVFSLPQDADAADALIQRVRTEPRNAEVLWLANGDRLGVGFLGLTEKTIDYRSSGKNESIERGRVVALGFDPGLVVYPRPSTFLELTLADGSRLGVSTPQLERGRLVATARFGAKLQVPLVEVAHIYPRSPAFTFLSERTPERERYIPYVGPARPYRRDATVDGHPFKLGGVEYERGIGTTSRTLLAYRLEKGDRRFQAQVGVDDRAGPLGNVVFRVLVGAREVYTSPPMSTGDPPRMVDVDVSGGSVLVLVTEFGHRGDVRDVADWVEARILR